MVKCIRTGPLVEFRAAWKLFLGLLLSVSLTTGVSGQTVPRPDHVVICVLENHGYWSIVGSPYAPFINGLIGRSALLQEYYALTHPSQPNYIMLYSGDAQEYRMIIFLREHPGRHQPGIRSVTERFYVCRLFRGFARTRCLGRGVGRILSEAFTLGELAGKRNKSIAHCLQSALLSFFRWTIIFSQMYPS